MPIPLLIGGIALLSAAAPAPADTPDEIVVEFMSWGARIDAWRIAADGSGAYDRVTEPRVGEPDFYAQQQRSGRIGSRWAFRKITERLAEIRQFLGRDVPCGQAVTDQPYVIVRWRGASGRLETLSHSYNCLSPTQLHIGRVIVDATRIAQVAAGLIPGEVGPRALQ